MQHQQLLFLVSYCIFLLRLPSEALPMIRGGGGVAPGQHSVISLEGKRLLLWLYKRKNRPEESVMYRSCWCSMSRSTCPVHALWPRVQRYPVNAPLFENITYDVFRKRLKDRLLKLKVN